MRLDEFEEGRKKCDRRYDLLDNRRPYMHWKIVLVSVDVESIACFYSDLT